MGGGLMQLVAYGAQDIYLTGNPQITFFKVVYRRHTNFAVESIEQTFNGSAKLGNKFSCTISRNGDLLSQVYLEMDVTLSQLVTNVKSITLQEVIAMGAGAASTMTVPTGTVAPRVLINTNNELVLNDTAANTIAISNGTNDYVNKTAAAGEVRIPTGNNLRRGEENGSKRVGLRAIKSIEVEIGGQCIDKHYGDWMDIWVGLSGNGQEWVKHERLVDASLPSQSVTNGRKMYIPLQFWFCKNPGLALPLIALQYHEVKLNVEFNSSVTYTHEANVITGAVLGSDPASMTVAGTALDFSVGAAVSINTINTVSMAINNCCVFCDYIFLDTDERRRFAQVSHEYLIEQLQFSNNLKGPTLSVSPGDNAGDQSADGQVELRFNHPVKELIWVAEEKIGNNAADTVILDECLLQLNGHDRFRKRAGNYFTRVQRYQHHTGDSFDALLPAPHIYSFALKPEEHQPSGTCNFSRIDNAVLSYKISNTNSIAAIGGTATQNTTKLRVYAVNYNVLRIMSGMGGLAYSN